MEEYIKALHGLRGRLARERAGILRGYTSSEGGLPLEDLICKSMDVTWNSEAGHVSGTIIKVHTKNVDYKGHTHHASEDEPHG